jgi:hypothetical protein
LIAFVGDSVIENRGNFFNLNQKIYNKYKGFKDFQMIMVVPLGNEKKCQQIVDEYTTLIRNWQDQATPIQRLRVFTIDELIRLTNLSGRFRIHASHRYTGEALRRCGFKQKRDWSAAGRNKRYWIWSSK